jgi:tetratricopeptide (TPR) repeat protein/DNA-binding CsgD family transcriptional regulator/transcriptional regulator with XRE-family HTH domain
MVKKPTPAKVNQLLRKARKERGWTHLAVAERIGITSPLPIIRWERGTAFPSPYHIAKLCQLFEKTPKELGLSQEEDTVHEHIQKTADAAAVSSFQLWNVPHRRNLFFTGREDLLQLLHDRLSSEQHGGATQSCALCGLGGIGKTQLAIEYAYRYCQEYRAVFWVRAASRETLMADFVALARLLALPGQDSQDQHITVEAARRWLTLHEGWLLILDNADDLSLVADFLPVGGAGHVLLTTRTSATGTLAVGIPVEQMDEDEGTLFLLHRAKLLPPDASLTAAPEELRTQARAIVRILGGLPLALDQAGAYMEESGCSLAEYLNLYQRSRTNLLKRRGNAPTSYHHTVATTWQISFQQAKQESPAAAELLTLCAFLHPDAIPETLLSEGATAAGPVLSTLVSDAFQFNEALEALRRFSLVRRNTQAKVLSIHRLVQVALRDAMDEQTQQQWAERAVRAVAAAFPEPGFDNWERCQQYLLHAFGCAELVEQYHFTFSEAVRLLDRAGRYFQKRALYVQAASLLEHSLSICEQVYGSEHPETATLLDHLAVVYQDQGRYEQAEPLHLRALTIRENTLGPEHPDTATALFNLDWLYYLQGKYEQAEAAAVRALAIRECVLGPEHPDTLDILGDLGLIYLAQGRYQQAEAILKRGSEIYKRTLGLEHPDTWDALHNLALVYHQLGNYEQAEQLFQLVISIEEKILGSDHHLTGIALDNLARVYQAQGRYEQAEALHQRALTIFEQALGPEHPDTLTALDRMAQLYQAQGKYEQAEALYQRVLHLREQVLGPQHPNTATTREGYEQLLKVMHASAAADQPAAQDAKLLSCGSPSIAEEDSRAHHKATPIASEALTQREIDVLRLLAQGLTSPQIAEQLTITPHTVNSHIRSIYSKLNISTRSAATRYAIEHNL